MNISNLVFLNTSDNFWIALIATSAFTFLFLIIFLIITFNIKKTNFYKKWSLKYWWFSPMIFTILGIIYGISFLWFFYEPSNQNNENYLLLALISITSIVSVSIYASIFIYVGASVGYLIGLLVFLNNEPLLIIYFFIIAYAIIGIFSFLNSLNNKYKISLYLKTILFQLLACGTIYLIFDFNIIDNTSQISTVESHLSFLFLAIIDWLFVSIGYYYFAIYTKTVRLYQNIKYDDGFFVNSSYAFNVISSYIKEHNTSLAIIFIIDINLQDDKNKFSKKELNACKIDILNHLKSSIGYENQITYFKTINNNYACMIDLRQAFVKLRSIYENNHKLLRDNDDIFHNLNLRLNETIEWSFKIYRNLKTTIKLFGSFYNIHSNSIEELINNTESLQANWYSVIKKTPIQIFDPNEYFVSNNFNPIFIKLINQYDTSKIKISLNEFIHNNHHYLIPTWINPSKLLSTKQEVLEAVPEELRDILLRHLSARSLKLYASSSSINNNRKIVIEYPLKTIIESGFNPGTLYKNVLAYQIKVSDVILNFDADQLSEYPLKINNRIKELIDLGFNISFYNVDKSNALNVQKFNPKLVFLKPLDKKQNPQCEYEKLSNHLRKLHLNVVYN